MKKLMVIAMSSAVLGLSAQAHAAVGIDKNLEKKLVKVCEAIKDNNNVRLTYTLKKYGFEYRQIAEGLRCNGVDAITWALQNNANNTAQIVAKRGDVDMKTLVAKR